MKRKDAWSRLIWAAFGQEMRIIDNNALRVEEDRPCITATFQNFSLWTPSQIIEAGNVEFTLRPTVEEGWTVLRAQLRGLGERKHYRLFRGTKELTWKQLPGDSVTIIPKEIPKPERGEEADTTSLTGIRPAREAGPMIRVKWQLFHWGHQPQSEVREVEIPEEKSFGQFVGKHATQLLWRSSPQARFRTGMTLQKTIPRGYLIKIEVKEIQSTADALGLNRPKPVTPPAPTPKPIPVAGELAGPKPTIPFAEGPKVNVYVKQERWLVNLIHRWMDISARMAMKNGVPAWALFKLKPIDGDCEAKTREGGREVSAFD
jgi:hypothetical protein